MRSTSHGCWLSRLTRWPHAALDLLPGVQGDGEQTSDARAPDIPDLWFIEERTDLRQWLTERGWAVTAIEALNLMQRYDRPPDDGLKDLAPRSVFIEGRLNTARRYA